MPLYHTLTPVVLDIGQAYTKIGFATEPAPRAIIPTTLKSFGKKEEPLVANLSETPNLDKIDLQRKLKAFFGYIYFKFLQVNPKDRRVIICESFANPTVFRDSCAHVLFHNFEVPSVLFAPHHLLACFTVAVETALVLDCSEYESTALPIIEGTPVVWAWHSAPLAGNAIHKQIQALIRAGGLVQKEDSDPVSLIEDVPKDVIEDVKVKSCYVASYERAKKIHAYKLAQWKAAAQPNTESSGETAQRPKPPPNMVYPMDGKTLLLIPGLVREEAPEILFEQDNDRLSVSTLVLDTIMQSPLDSRRTLASNIIVSGGTAMIPGFLHRLLSELGKLVESEELYKLLSECEFRVHKLPVPPNIASWLGASIYASLEVFPLKSITKEHFTQNKNRLPDWCVLDVQPPEMLPERPTSLITGIKGLSYVGKSGSSRPSAGRTSTGSAPRTSAATAALASLKLAQSEAKQAATPAKK